MESPIERVIADVLRYREATRRLIQGLENQVTSSDEDVEILRSGITMEAKMRRSNSAKLSRELTQRLEEFEEVRRDIRLSITSALRAEGLSAAEIGELFGVTRQLASRFARERRGRSVGGLRLLIGARPSASERNSSGWLRTSRRRNSLVGTTRSGHRMSDDRAQRHRPPPPREPPAPPGRPIPATPPRTPWPPRGTRVIAARPVRSPPPPARVPPPSRVAPTRGTTQSVDTGSTGAAQSGTSPTNSSGQGGAASSAPGVARPHRASRAPVAASPGG